MSIKYCKPIAYVIVNDLADILTGSETGIPNVEERELPVLWEE